MNSKRFIPAGEVSAEIKISNSTFIASAAPAFTVEEAKEYILKVRNQHPSAAHNVPVFIIGHPPSVVEHSSDDGEPSGTAGRPALAVLRGSGLGDIVIVITRYFGGTKLGTGGLVRAYSDSVRAVLEKIKRAEKISTVTTEIEIPYALFEQVSKLTSDFDGHILEQKFEVEVNLRVKFIETKFEGFQDGLVSLSNGKIEALVIDTNPDDIFPSKF